MIPNPYLPLFVAFEGPDGCGKSEILKHTELWLKNRGFAVITTKEPDKNAFWGRNIYADLQSGQELDKISISAINPFGFQAWYSCDSKRHMQERILPVLTTQGPKTAILTDRFRLSCVYGVDEGLDQSRLIIKEEIWRLVQLNIGILQEYFIWPDLSLVFDVEIETLLDRLKKKGKKLDRHERETRLARVRRNYHVFVEMFYAYNCHLVSNNGSVEETMETVQHLLQQTIAAKEKRLGRST